MLNEESKPYGRRYEWRSKKPTPEPKPIRDDWTPPELLKTEISVEYKSFKSPEAKTVARCATLQEAEQLALELGTGHYARQQHLYKETARGR